MEQQGLADYGGGNPTTDATLHSLLSTSPHAAQALRQTGLKEAGSRAFRRHRDRDLLTQGQAVQGSLFHELKGVPSGRTHGYVANPDAMEIPDTDDGFEQHFDRYHQDVDKVEHRAGEMVWPTHMSKNQFGESPRTIADVGSSLGVRPAHARQQGFTDR